MKIEGSKVQSCKGTKVYPHLMSLRWRRNHTRDSTKIGDILCGVSSVISLFGRNDKLCGYYNLKEFFHAPDSYRDIRFIRFLNNTFNLNNLWLKKTLRLCDFARLKTKA